MLVLASNSPRRKQLLALTGWEFTVLPAQVDESVLPGELPPAYVSRLAETKARAVFSIPGVDLRRPGVVVIAADTAVVDGTNILGKPQDTQEAEAMLRSLRGRTHQVYTGLAALNVGGRFLSDMCVSEVVMREYSDAEMLDYIASGDPLDKAGAYAIQHVGFRPVERLQGCYANVMGLPVCHLVRLLAGFGLHPEMVNFSAKDVALSCQKTLDAPCEVYTQITGVVK